MKIKFLGESEIEGEAIGNFSIEEDGKRVFSFSSQIADRAKLKETFTNYLRYEEQKQSNKSVIDTVIIEAEQEILMEKK